MQENEKREVNWPLTIMVWVIVISIIGYYVLSIIKEYKK